MTCREDFHGNFVRQDIDKRTSVFSGGSSGERLLGRALRGKLELLLHAAMAYCICRVTPAVVVCSLVIHRTPLVLSPSPNGCPSIRPFIRATWLPVGGEEIVTDTRSLPFGHGVNASSRMSEDNCPSKRSRIPRRTPDCLIPCSRVCPLNTILDSRVERTSENSRALISLPRLS